MSKEREKLGYIKTIKETTLKLTTGKLECNGLIKVCHMDQSGVLWYSGR